MGGTRRRSGHRGGDAVGNGNGMDQRLKREQGLGQVKRDMFFEDM